MNRQVFFNATKTVSSNCNNYRNAVTSSNCQKKEFSLIEKTLKVNQNRNLTKEDPKLFVGPTEGYEEDLRAFPRKSCF